jgi:hypothetical protein
MEAACSSETSVSAHKSTRYHKFATMKTPNLACDITIDNCRIIPARVSQRANESNESFKPLKGKTQTTKANTVTNRGGP